MSMARFAMICDSCKTRGPEYDGGFTLECRECGGDFCAKCRDLLADVEADVGRAGDSLCVQCAIEAKAVAR